jgi:hypothetical protein
VLDLYARIWQDNPLGGDEYVISCDEKTLGQVSRGISRGGGYQVSTSWSTSSALPSTRRSTSPFSEMISGNVRWRTAKQSRLNPGIWMMSPGHR